MKSLTSLQRSSLVLLGLLTICFRYPITNSPIGADGFFYKIGLYKFQYHRLERIQNSLGGFNGSERPNYQGGNGGG